jgi:hypothetical protein
MPALSAITFIAMTPIINIDETDQLSVRTLSLNRYKRNHDHMNEVFKRAAFGVSITILQIHFPSNSRLRRQKSTASTESISYIRQV